MTLHENRAPESDYDVAIVGVSCRFPGARNINEFWQNLANGVESITQLSDQEILDSGVPLAHLQNPNYVKAAPILDEPGFFDAAFFGFSPMEARMLDPQHRILLELAYEALEDAGCDPDRYPGSIGVFAGSAMNTYFMHSGLTSQFAEEYIPTLIANDKDFLSTRISYKLNLKGPSINVQTACSTSLVAVHLARQSLLNGEADMALAGAVSVRVPHKAGYFYDGGGVVSPDGHVRAFDARANGTVFGSGAGVVVLKRLADAVSGGDRIYAVIKGSAVNNDGSEKAGYTAPSVNSQADAVIEALANAGIDADSISYVEAHGSGTPVGDPIEVFALTKAFRTQTQRSGYCAIGSVKTNLGHLDAAAGMAGIIKTALALRHRMLPPSLHYAEPNPEIDFAATPFFVNTKLTPWTCAGPRRAGVMSTGMGGTNAHLVLEEAPEPEAQASSGLPNLLILSARTGTALDMATERLLVALKDDISLNMGDVAYTLQTGRKQFPHRRFLVCKDRADAIAGLEKESKRLVSSMVEDAARRPVIFLLPGIGDQYVGMAAELYEKWGVFRQEVDRCAQILETYLGMDIREIIYPKDNQWRNGGKAKGIDLKKMLGRRNDEPEDDASRTLDETAYAQPALFTIEYALTRLWQHFGVKPAAIVGHSMGEYVAACLAGVLSLEDALRLIAVRARLVSKLPKGAMLAVTLSDEELQPLLGPELSISLINGPNLCVVAGPAQAVADFERLLNAKGILCRFVRNAHAFHSRMLDPIVPPLEEEVRKIRLNEPAIPYVSNLTGAWISKAEATDPAYWARHANHPARFNDALHTMWQIKNAVLLEAGPGNTLSVLAMQHPGRKNAERPATVSSLHPHYDNQPDCEFLLHSLGKLFLTGVEISWASPRLSEQRRKTALPTYPFEHENYWLQTAGVPVASHPDRVSIQKNPNISEWFYLPSWKRMAPHCFIPSEISKRLGGSQVWLVYADDGEVISRVIEGLKSTNQEVVTVRAGECYQRVDTSSFIIEAGNTEHYEWLIKALQTENRAPGNVLHAWSLTNSPREQSEEDAFNQAQEKGFYSVLFFVRAIARLKIRNPLNLFIVSNHIQEVNSKEVLRPEKATVLGPCMVIPQEYPHIRAKNIDLELPEDGHADDPMIHHLISELVLADSEMFVAHRGTQRWVQTYEPIQIDELVGVDPHAFRERGVYLITGGLGDIGYEISKHLAETYRARLILTGRSQLPAREEWKLFSNSQSEDPGLRERIRRIQSIEESGAEVMYVNADVADLRSMEDAIKRTQEVFGQLHGVIHGAGIVGPKGIREIADIDTKVCDLHFKAKAQGLQVLERLLAKQSLDLCILLSSLTPILGGIGEVAYSSSNVFMDTFTRRHNRESRTRWLSVNWDLWRLEAKHRDNARIGRTLEDLGIHAEEGMKVLELVAPIKEIPQIVVSTGDLSARIKQWIKLTSLRESISAKQSCGLRVIDSALGHVQSRQRDASDETERVIAQIWQDVLGIEQIGVDDDFSDLGGHSLLAIKIVSELRRAFQVDLPIRVLFDAPTVARLAHDIKERIVAEIASLSDAEVRKRLARS